MTARVPPPGLRQGYADGWPPATPVGILLEHVRTGNTVTTAALVAGLDPRAVADWTAQGAAELDRADGVLSRVAKGRRPFAALAHALERAHADCEARLTAQIMITATSDSRDAWRAAGWLLERNQPDTPVAAEVDDSDSEEIAELGRPV